MRTDEEWMRVALDEADAARAKGEVRSGACSFGAERRALARGHNQRETLARSRPRTPR